MAIESKLNIKKNSNKVVIRIRTLGLGNAFFQYAAARNIAINNNSPLLFDISGCIGAQLELEGNKFVGSTEVIEKFSHFRMAFQIATSRDVIETRGSEYKNGKKGRLDEVVRDKLGLWPATYIKEESKNRFKRQEKIACAYGPVYIEGGLINPHYFSENKKAIIDELELSKELPSQYKKFQEKIDGENSVSIHLRGGDYRNKNLNNLYPIYGAEYVASSIESISKKVINPKYYLFSDEIDWAKTQMPKGVDVAPVELSSSEPWAEMELMSKCKHNIISNSTFSWWAAYRNRNTKSITICPKIWRTDGIDISELIMSGWEVI